MSTDSLHGDSDSAVEPEVSLMGHCTECGHVCPSRAERDRLQHIIDCANTPLMRDVMAERDRLRAGLLDEELLARIHDHLPTVDGCCVIPIWDLRDAIKEALADA